MTSQDIRENEAHRLLLQLDPNILISDHAVWELANFISMSWDDKPDNSNALYFLEHVPDPIDILRNDYYERVMWM